MENIEEFCRWMQQMLRDAKEKLQMTDETLAWILFEEATRIYFRTVRSCGQCPLNK